MDLLLEHIRRMFDDDTFTKFNHFNERPQTLRDEMLRYPENSNEDSAQVHDERFFDTLPLKPNIFDRPKNNMVLDFKKQDVILDGQSSAPWDFIAPEDSVTRSHSWSCGHLFSSKRIIGSDGNDIDIETTIVRKSDGSEIHTTIDRSPQGNRKRVIYKKPNGEVCDVFNDGSDGGTETQLRENMFNPMIPYSESQKESTLFGNLKQWYRSKW